MLYDSGLGCDCARARVCVYSFNCISLSLCISLPPPVQGELAPCRGYLSTLGDFVAEGPLFSGIPQYGFSLHQHLHNDKL